MEDNSGSVQLPYEFEVGAPELQAFAGMAVSLTHRQVRIGAPTGFRALELHQTDGIILALDWVRGETHHLWGSAVLVAPGVAITAKHTIDAIREAGFLTEDGGYLLAYGFHARGMTMTWNAVKIEQDPSGDLAVLTLVRTAGKPDWPLEAPLPLSVATIAARMPHVGETISLIGFRATQEEFIGPGPSGYVGLGLYGAVGPVLDVFPEGRSAHYRKPAAYVEADTLGGMSGGAAFDFDGNLIGIISRGVSGTSFVLFTWPVIFTEIEVAWPAGLSASPTTLHAMAEAGLTHIIGIENLSSGQDANGTLTVTLAGSIL